MIFLPKRTNKFNFTTCQLVFVCFLEESEDTKKIFQNYLTFSAFKREICSMLIVDQQNRSAEGYCFNMYEIFVWVYSILYLLSVLNLPLDEDLKIYPFISGCWGLNCGS